MKKFKNGDKVRIKKSSGVLCFDSCTKSFYCPIKGDRANKTFTVNDSHKLHYLKKDGQISSCWFYDEWLEPAMKWIRMK